MQLDVEIITGLVENFEEKRLVILVDDEEVVQGCLPFFFVLSFLYFHVHFVDFYDYSQNVDQIIILIFSLAASPYP